MVVAVEGWTVHCALSPPSSHGQRLTPGPRTDAKVRQPPAVHEDAVEATTADMRVPSFRKVHLKLVALVQFGTEEAVPSKLVPVEENGRDERK